MKLQVFLFVFVWLLFTACTAKSKEVSAETPMAEEKTDTALSDSKSLNDPKWGKIADRDTLPALPAKKDRDVFVRTVFPGHEFLLPDKFFVSGNDIYRVHIPTARSSGIFSELMRYDIGFLEFGDSLLIMRGSGDNLLVETSGSMRRSEWEQILKVFGSVYDACSTRGENYTLLYYNDELIQMDNASGDVVKRIAAETGRSSLFKRTFVFDSGYILFSSINDAVEEPEMPDKAVFRIYNENLDYIDFDGTDDLITGGYMPLCYPLYTDNKAGISVLYYSYYQNSYITTYLFDFTSREVIRIKPRPITILESYVFDETMDVIFQYPPGIDVNLVQNLFWFPENTSVDERWLPSGLSRFPEVYPVYNRELFFKAFNPEKYGRITPQKNEKESGIFSYTDNNYNIRESLTFSYNYDRGILVQNSAGTKHSGTELEKGMADTLLTTAVSANAFLTEGAAEYRAENMREFSNTPWVVKKTDLADAEITVKSESPINWLVIGNGFYHAEKPDLYGKNSRPKEIVIMYEGVSGINDMEERVHRVILDDTFELQFVPLLYTSMGTQTISIKILSVYPGTSYDDVCVNYIGAIGIPSLGACGT
jgi:hypothetical protein